MRWKVDDDGETSYLFILELIWLVADDPLVRLLLARDGVDLGLGAGTWRWPGAW